MGADDNLAAYRALAETEDRGDLSHHGDYLHGDLVVHMTGAEPVVGIDNYVGMIRTMYSALGGLQLTKDDEFATEDRVVSRWRARGTHDIESFGFPATGKTIEIQGMSLWEFDGGKARVGWIFLDLPSLVSQLES